MSEKDTGFSFTVGFILGAVAGVAMGFLYAPQIGKETRTLLKEKAEVAREKVTDIADKAKKAVVEPKHRVKAKLGHKKGTG